MTDFLGQGPREDVSSHTKDFGSYGDDPLWREVGVAKDMTGSATTRDLAVGTARSTRQLPGQILLHVPCITAADCCIIQNM